MSEKKRASSVRLSAAEVEAETIAPGRLFLDRFDETSLRRELEGGGVAAGLRDRGFDEVLLSFGRSAGEHTLRVFPKGRRVWLVDLRVRENTISVGDARARASGLEILSVLTVNWLALQNPDASFTQERPQLPGQRYPGLGVGRRLYALLRTWAARWGKDALVAFPQHYHNALFYAETFRFFSAERQGRFGALARDLAGRTIAEGSWAVSEGRVFETKSGQVLRWEGDEMFSPLTRGVAAYLESAPYQAVVEATMGGLDYGVRPRSR